MDVPPLHNIGGTCPPCPIGIDAPGHAVIRRAAGGDGCMSIGQPIGFCGILPCRFEPEPADWVRV